MKKLIIILTALFILNGCASVSEFLGKPEISLKSMSIEELDLEGMTFRCDYTIKNPYPVGIKLAGMESSILYNNSLFLEIETIGGLDLAAGKTNQNSIIFKVPYDQLWKLAGESRDRKTLPFTLKGSASLDLSAVPVLTDRSVNLPFSKDFEIPVFRPRFQISEGRIVMPSLKDTTKALIAGGMNVLKAGTAAAKLIEGEPVGADILNSIDLDVTLMFNLEIENSGGAPWSLDPGKSSIDSGNGSLITLKALNGPSPVSGSGQTLQMAAVLNTREWGSFIAALAAGKIPYTSLRIESALTFPGLPYNTELPFSINRQISLNSFRFGS